MRPSECHELFLLLLEALVRLLLIGVIEELHHSGETSFFLAFSDFQLVDDVSCFACCGEVYQGSHFRF